MSFLALIITALAQSSQPPIRLVMPTLVNPSPGDVRMTQFEDPKGASWRCFSVDALPDGPVAIVQVGEVRQQNPPSTWSVFVTNRDFLPVSSVILAAAVVEVNGAVKAIQNLPPIKNLKPQQIIRKEVPVRVTVIAPTDRVVFFVRTIKSETGDFAAADAEVAELIKSVALRLPVP